MIDCDYHREKGEFNHGYESDKLLRKRVVCMARKNFLQKMEETFDKWERIAEDPKLLLQSPLFDLNFDKSCSKKKLEQGDIIAATRMNGVYQHFAVYIGDGKVVHFAAKDGDWAGTPTIHEAPFEDFLRDSKEFEILEFSETRKCPVRYAGQLPKVGATALLLAVPPDSIIELVRDAQYHLYSPEETVERAKMVAEQCVGEGSKIETWMNGHKYNLVFNNCEHFAIWCKTGVHESRQVDRILRIIMDPLPQSPMITKGR